MRTAKELDYTIHHLCIYDKDPRNHMWSYLKWHHGVTGYFTGETYHIADEGHADYTFLGCGGRAFQIQLEAPPFQFRYEQEWYARHGNGYNHICWIVNNARESYDQIRAAGAAVCQEFQENRRGLLGAEGGDSRDNRREPRGISWEPTQQLHDRGAG